MQKYAVYRILFALARIACCSNEQSIFCAEEKSSMESSFCSQWFFFLSFAWFWICFLFKLFIQLSCCCSTTHNTHPCLHFLECRNKDRSSTQFWKFQNQQPSQIILCIIIFLQLLRALPFPSILNFLIWLLFIRFGFDLVSVALFMCPNAVHSWDCALWMAFSYYGEWRFILSIWAFRMSFLCNGETDTKMKLKAKKCREETTHGQRKWAGKHVKWNYKKESVRCLNG